MPLKRSLQVSLRFFKAPWILYNRFLFFLYCSYFITSDDPDLNGSLPSPFANRIMQCREAEERVMEKNFSMDNNMNDNRKK